MRELAMIVAMNSRRVIGKDGDLPWRIREDLRHFKRITMGHAIIMGRKTWDSIGRPLPGRRSIVITRNQQLTLPECDVCHSLEEALTLAYEGGDTCPMIIGGATIYQAALPYTTVLYLTEVDNETEGDTFFPVLDDDWFEADRTAGQTPGVSFVVLKRKKR